MQSPTLSKSAPPAAQVPDPARTGPCAYCGAPLAACGRALWHTFSGCVSCDAVEEGSGYAEPEGWGAGPCATVAFVGER